MVSPIRVAVTGAAGQIGYALIFRLASGQVFGPQQPIILHLIEVPPVMPALDGVMMELDDCAFPTLAGVEKADSSHLEDGFRDCNFVLCVGSVPRKEGMERGDLIRVNGPIFTSTGKAIQAAAAPDVRVVGDRQSVQHELPDRHAPCAEDSPRAMVCHDAARSEPGRQPTGAQGRRRRRTASGTSASGETIRRRNFPISITRRSTAGRRRRSSATRRGSKARSSRRVQKRGAAVIKARGASSAASAANAVDRHGQKHRHADRRGDCISAAVCSDGSYGVDAGLIFGYPLTTDGKTLEDSAGSDAQRLRPRRRSTRRWPSFAANATRSRTCCRAERRREGSPRPKSGRRRLRRRRDGRASVSNGCLPVRPRGSDSSLRGRRKRLGPA